MGIIVSVCPTSEHVSIDAEHASADTEHASADTEHVSTGAEQASLSAGTVLASAIHAFVHLAIHEERHSDTVMMSEWLSSFIL